MFGRRVKPRRLVYAAAGRCPCGAGLAYVRGDDCWDCSEILLDTAKENVKHSDRLPFAFYEIKSENKKRGTTRPE